MYNCQIYVNISGYLLKEFWLCDDKQFLPYHTSCFMPPPKKTREHLVSKNTNVYLYYLRVQRILVNVETYDLSVLNFLRGVCNVKECTSWSKSKRPPNRNVRFCITPLESISQLLENLKWIIALSLAGRTTEHRENA